MANGKVTTYEGTGLEIPGPSASERGFQALASVLGGMSQRQKESRAQMTAVLPALVAAKMVKPWESSKDGEKMRFGGRDWAVTAPSADLQQMLTQAHLAQAMQSLTGVPTEKERYGKVLGLLGETASADPMGRVEAMRAGGESEEGRQAALLNYYSQLVGGASAMENMAYGSMYGQQAPQVQGADVVRVFNKKTQQYLTRPRAEWEAFQASGLPEAKDWTEIK